MRKLLVLIVAVTAMTFSASSAFAQVEIEDATEGGHCGEATLEVHHVEGGCVVHLIGDDIELISHSSAGVETVQAGCSTDFYVHVGEDGEGWITDITFQGEEPCGTNVRECREPEPDGEDKPWHAQIEETGALQSHLMAKICLRIQNAVNLTGHLEIDLTVDQPQSGG